MMRGGGRVVVQRKKESGCEKEHVVAIRTVIIVRDSVHENRPKP